MISYYELEMLIHFRNAMIGHIILALLNGNMPTGLLFFFCDELIELFSRLGMPYSL